MKKLLRWVRSRWKWLLWGLIVLVMLALFGVLVRGDRETIAGLPDQRAYESWQTEEKPYGQAAVYLREGDAIPQESLYSIRMAVEKVLTDGSVPSEDYPWFYAASRTELATLTGEGTTSSVELTLISGEYFRLHPMPVRYGWYMDESDVMHDRIVLDRQTAWDLFAADNVAGQFLTLNGARYQVAAVVDYPPGQYQKLAAEGVCRAWVFADSPAFASAGAAPPEEGTAEAPLAAAADSQGGGFTCIEVVLPQPVKNFALSTLQGALKDIVPEDTVFVDNGGRFSLPSRWSVLREIGTRGISTKGVEHPWYENAARLTENHLALRLIPEGILLGLSLISVLLWLWMLNKKRTWGFHSIKELGENVVDKKRQRDYAKRKK